MDKIKIKKVIHYEGKNPYVTLNNKHFIESDYKGRLWYINPNDGTHNSIISHYDTDRWACNRTIKVDSDLYKEVLSLLNRGLKKYLWENNLNNIKQ